MKSKASLSLSLVGLWLWLWYSYHEFPRMERVPLPSSLIRWTLILNEAVLTLMYDSVRRHGHHESIGNTNRKHSMGFYCAYRVSPYNFLCRYCRDKKLSWISTTKDEVGGGEEKAETRILDRDAERKYSVYLMKQANNLSNSIIKRYMYVHNID